MLVQYQFIHKTENAGREKGYSDVLNELVSLSLLVKSRHDGEFEHQRHCHHSQEEDDEPRSFG
jgi:hypothetical protein